MLLTWLIDKNLTDFRECYVMSPSFPPPRFALFLSCLFTTGNLRILCRLLLKKKCDASIYLAALFSEEYSFLCSGKQKELLQRLPQPNTQFQQNTVGHFVTTAPCVQFPLDPLLLFESWTWPKPVVYWESVLRSVRVVQRVLEALALNKAFKPGVPARRS